MRNAECGKPVLLGVRWQAHVAYSGLAQSGARHRFVFELRNCGSPWSAVASACWLLGLRAMGSATPLWIELRSTRPATEMDT
jgi:hypothetical protein